MRKNCDNCKYDAWDYVGAKPCSNCASKGEETPSFWEAGGNYVPLSNADRIRAMTDEELARHLHCIGWDCHLCAEHRRLDNEPLLRGERCDENCFEHCLEWLQQPAEGD